MKIKLLIGTGIAAGALMAYAAKDPVIMTVNGVDVPLSEFEYLYHKNTQQQVDPQPLEDYVEMFKIYKLKVADALASGVDTLPKFIRDMEQYKRELSAPYLADSTYLVELARDQYSRMGQEVDVNHIMFMKSPDRAKLLKTMQLADSIHTLLENGADFAELAEKYSEDRGSKNRGGNMGFIPAGVLPYNFETTMYALPEGAISGIVESPVGLHIIKGGKRRPASGSVLASHILIMDKDRSEAQAKALADSLYTVLAADPSQFEEAARKYSDDKGSGAQGGALPWFTPGQMVPEFSEAAFALKDGEVGKPVHSQFGWHVIYRKDHRDIASFDDTKADLIKRISGSQDRERARLTEKHDIDRFAKKFKLKPNRPVIESLHAFVEQTGMMGDTLVKKLNEMGDTPIFWLDKSPRNARGLVPMIKILSAATDADLHQSLDRCIDRYYTVQLRDAERDYLREHNADLRNLLNEYHDGSLLYEVSLEKVWDKASNDNEGLKNYFDTHRSEFTWTEPRVKGFLVKATDEEVAAKVRERLPQLGNDTIISTIKKEFGKKVQIDRVLVKRGDNQMIDYLVFNPGDSQPPLSANYPVYFMYNPEIIAAPQTVDDVKGLVTAAYQDQLEHEWVKELKEKYPVVINQKVLKKVK